MAAAKVGREVSLALIVAVATAASLITLTPAPWTLALPAAVFLGAAGLLADVLIFGKPVKKSTSAGKKAIGLLTGLAAVCALCLAFVGGTLTHGGSGSPFPYVANGLHVVDFIYFAPTMAARSDQTVAPGTPVLVDCYVTEKDGDWYRLTDNRGWVTDKEFLPAPHTGRGSPLRCP
jgi:hypothetical protein